MGRLLKKKPDKKKKKKVLLDEAGQEIEELSNKTLTLKRISKDGRGISQKKNHLVLPKFLDISIQFLRDVRVELKKVTWPSYKHTIGSTAVVILLVMIISAFLGVIDIALAGLVRFILH
ncbi:preprotein translocase subunit SecE [Candidatus Magnetomoraceae bacterium gMMP-15]